MRDEHNQQPAAAYLEVLNGPLVGTRFPLGTETIIGRDDEDVPLPGGGINLADTRVSRQHARVFSQRGRYYIEDCHSTNGTYLNAFRLQAGAPCVLREGSNIQVGAVHMRFRPALTETDSRLSRHNLVAPWKSEIGLNEEVFDLSLTANPDAGASQANISMMFQAPEMPSPDVSVVLDAPAVVDALKKASGGRDEAGEGEAKNEDLRRLRAMAQVSIGLGSSQDSESLFAKVMEFIYVIFPTAERAFVVLRDKDSQEFKPAAASTREPSQTGEMLALSEAIVDEVLSQRRSILSSDVMHDQRFDAHQSILQMGIRSMMCVPVFLDDDVMGLIQVDTHSQTHSFDEEDLHILTGIGAQVAIALKNVVLVEDIGHLFESFVTASVHAIEARDPTTAGHSFRVAEYSERLAAMVDRSTQQSLQVINFSREQMQELRYAALLHDFGKVGVREHVLIKARKLYHSQMDVLQARFRHARASLERQAYRELIDQHSELSPAEFKMRRAAMDKRLAGEVAQLQQFMQMIQHANEPTVLDDDVTDDLQKVADFVFPGDEGESLALLTGDELDALTLARGSLTPEERLEIQSHVNHTFAFLNHIPWTNSLSAVADIAHAHHEKFDGSGYPRGLAGEDIPIQSRIMTVADIFDALTAGDRPYKTSLGVEQALNILQQEAKAGKVDPLLVDVFIDSKSYQLFE
jgi:HD-GYP domain-containing protein (c-di-GMP phosphodiesterase class II)/pSer/pThr/pTyr-binding forkhead associated (FHA) protein